MGSKTGISWTDSTWNPWHGCIKISPGCKNCYMYRDKQRYGQDPMIVTRSKTTFNDPLKWKESKKVFTCSWSDFFIEQADAWRQDAWDIIRQTPHLTYQILTKRPERIIGRLPSDWGMGYENVWLGISAENQEYLDSRVGALCAVPSLTKFVSYEPALSAISFRWAAWEPFKRSGTVNHLDGLRRINWVVAGGESGDGHRAADPEWFRSVLAECREAGVAFWMKQQGGHPNPRHDLADFPEDLQIQEFPR